MTALSQRKGFEYRSKEEMNGLPLIHINIGIQPETGRPKVAKGVVAIGNVAIGVVSIGAAAFGIVTLGAFGLGVVSLASCAIGMIALGAVALGFEYALGAAVLSARHATGILGLDLSTVIGSLILAALIAGVIWVLRNVWGDRPQR